MAITDIPIFNMLRTRLDWSQQRQKVLAENVTNADTPNYRARDLLPPKFELPGQASGILPVSLAKTEPGHIGASGAGGSQFSTASDHYDVGPTGNAGEPRRRDDEGGGEPDGFPGGDRALHAQPEFAQDRAGQDVVLNRDVVAEISS